LNGKEILETSSVKDLCEKCVDDIVSSDLLNADEKNVFEAVVVWSETQCVKKNIEVNDKNLRDILSRILYHVRFPLMPLSYYLCQSKSSPSETISPFISRSFISVS
jgi:hypothetical protein